jgi:AhpD family alkylhydroperoxidase
LGTPGISKTINESVEETAKEIFMAAETRMEYAGFIQTAPGVTTALTALSKAVSDSGLDKALTELIKIRASQINGCAFCVQYHLNIARKASVPQAKLDLLAVWREVGIFTAEERAALAWSEALTRVTPAGVTNESYEDALAQFGESKLAFLTAAIAGINAWNRIAMAYRFTPPIPQDAPQV